MRLSSHEEGLIKIIAFRRQMRVGLSHEILKRFWPSISAVDNLTKKLVPTDFVDGRSRAEVIKSKSNLALEKIRKLDLINKLGLIKFIGISGSVASGKYKNGEDIDIFVVVANHSIWLVRGFIKLILKNEARMFEDKDVEDALCFNFLVEERALTFEDNIFNFHELIHLVPLVNEDYYSVILDNNRWLNKDIEIKENNSSLKFKSNILLIPLEYLAFLFQWLYMILRGHKPDKKRLLEGFVSGRIQFYPKDYQAKKNEAYKIELKKLLDRFGK